MILKVAKARIDAAKMLIDRAEAKLRKAQEGVVKADNGLADTLVSIDKEADVLQTRVDDLRKLVKSARG